MFAAGRASERSPSDVDMVKLYAALARFSALLAGVLLVVITGLTVASVAGRSLAGWAINGDFELVAFAAGGSVALFMPWCQVRRGNIIVDFFTTGVGERARDNMDRFGALLLAWVMAFMSWRSALGGANAWNTGSGSMMIGFPEWIVYAVMTPALALTALIAFDQAVRGFAAYEAVSSERAQQGGER